MKKNFTYYLQFIIHDMDANSKRQILDMNHFNYHHYDHLTKKKKKGFYQSLCKNGKYHYIFVNN